VFLDLLLILLLSALATSYVPAWWRPSRPDVF